MGVLKELLDKQDELASSRFKLVPAHYNFLLFGNDNDSSTKLPDIWHQNALVNLKKLKCKSVYDLPPHKGQAVIVVGASPILKRQWKELKKADERFVIIAVNSVLKYLLKRGIRVDYTICIDGQTSPNWSMDIGETDITAIFSPYTAPEVIDYWKGPKYVVPFRMGKDYNLWRRIKRRWGGPHIAGGNAFNSAVSIFAMNTEAKIYLLAGNELSFKKRYYVHGKSTQDTQNYYFLHDVKGRKVNTIVPLYSYKIWLENFMALGYPDCVWYNCSEGVVGVDTDRSLMEFVYQKPLGEAIYLIKQSWAFESLPWDAKNKYIYDHLYGTDQYYPQNGRGAWNHITEWMPDFTKALDVGCGTGVGIRYARSLGHDVYGADISDQIKNIWYDHGIAEYCHVAPAHDLPFRDNEFDMVVCTECLEHIPEDGIEPTLNEMYRVGSDRFYFTIALTPDSKFHQKGVKLHTTLKKWDWWAEKLEKAGYKVGCVGHDEYGAFVLAVKSELPYINGKQLFKEPECVSNVA